MSTWGDLIGLSSIDKHSYLLQHGGWLVSAPAELPAISAGLHHRRQLAWDHHSTARTPLLRSENKVILISRIFNQNLASFLFAQNSYFSMQNKEKYPTNPKV